jgi:GMP synthase (glutamine-hydrolysing)
MKILWLAIRACARNIQSTSIAKADQRQKMKGQKALKPIALIKTGGTIPEIVPRYGDFEDWFSAAVTTGSLLTIDVFRQQLLPDLTGLSGIVITGSAAMVSDREDWSERTAGWLKGAVGSGLPILGVCYGHQLLAHALGGRVGVNPNGRQIGTVAAKKLTSSVGDSLLGFLPDDFTVQTSHSESVLELPPNAVRLASSPLDENFSIRFDEQVWGVQFHPEFSATVMQEYIRIRADALRAEGLDPVALGSLVVDTGQARSVLKTFGNIVAKTQRSSKP